MRLTETKKVFIDYITDETLSHHLQMMKEMITRDKNHPSVVMWSIGNEAATYEKESYAYFEKVAAGTRKLDPSRPITLAHCPIEDDCYVSQLADVICLNRYNSWYFDPGHLEVIEFQLEQNLKSWYERFGKPIIVSEYGADTIAG